MSLKQKMKGLAPLAVTLGTLAQPAIAGAAEAPTLPETPAPAASAATAYARTYWSELPCRDRATAWRTWDYITHPEWNGANTDFQFRVCYSAYEGNLTIDDVQIKQMEYGCNPFVGCNFDYTYTEYKVTTRYSDGRSLVGTPKQFAPVEFDNSFSHAKYGYGTVDADYDFGYYKADVCVRHVNVDTVYPRDYTGPGTQCVHVTLK
jgi:hypothetical protein